MLHQATERASNKECVLVLAVNHERAVLLKTIARSSVADRQVQGEEATRIYFASGGEVRFSANEVHSRGFRGVIFRSNGDDWVIDESQLPTVPVVRRNRFDRIDDE